MFTNEGLITSLREAGVLTPRIEEAFRAVDRACFVAEELRAVAYYDQALPLAHGQTISQPYTVAFMLNLLDPHEGQSIVDVGSGSGWVSALLAFCVGTTGHVYAIERISELCEYGKKACAVFPDLSSRITFFCKDAWDGLPDEASGRNGFDGIIAAATLSKTPRKWREQIKIGGTLIYPQGNTIVHEVKKNDRDFSKKVYHGFVFVPFVRDGQLEGSDAR